MKIAVIIPFYQREKGILPRALASVFSQVLPDGAELWVIVVDDASPVPGAQEMADLSDSDHSRVTLVTQPNGGPGHARNTALDLVAERGADYVAFLDSDDIWKPNHLRDALAALGAGYDFYFCDHKRFGAQETYAASVPALEGLRDPATPGFRVLDPQGPVITVDGKVAFSAYLKEYLSQTSTIVLRQAMVRRLRFDPELRGAGEDQLFWIMLVAMGARLAISWRANVDCGQGVNIYFAAFDFASVKSADRIGYMCLFRKKCTMLALDDRDRIETGRYLRRYRRAYSYMFIRAILRGQRPDLRLFLAICKRMPLMPVAMPFRFLAVLPRRHEESRLW